MEPVEHIVKPSVKLSKKLERLKSENEMLKTSTTCRMCKLEIVQTLSLPRSHLQRCEKCSDVLENVRRADLRNRTIIFRIIDSLDVRKICQFLKHHFIRPLLRFKSSG